LINDVQVSIFKREGQAMGLVPMISYKTFIYDTQTCDFISSSRENYDIIRIDKSNMNIFIDFYKENVGQFSASIIADYSNILELIITNNLFIYVLISREEHKSPKAIYIFRDSKTTFNYNNNPQDILILVASIKEKKLKDDIFTSFFYNIIIREEFAKLNNYIAIENLSHNKIIVNKYPHYLTHITSSYYFYNYICKTLVSEKTLIII
jgi:hypothetical protein